ncbi:MAG: phosphate transport system regulatory protein PhoU [Nocardia sp.]|nr:phosphate transport system regulatory protein PhoU [Nocardia sp.]
MGSGVQREVQELIDLLEVMCRHDRTLITAASNALMHADLELSEDAIDLGRVVETIRMECEELAIELLASRSPHYEPQQVVTAIQMAADLARMGVLATHIATAARRRHPAFVVPASVRPIVEQMGAEAMMIASSASIVLGRSDPRIAAQLDGQDDTMDRLHRRLLQTVLADDWDGGTTAAVDMALVGRYYERFADHAVRVGHRTIFLLAGTPAPS